MFFSTSRRSSSSKDFVQSIVSCQVPNKIHHSQEPQIADSLCRLWRDASKGHQLLCICNYTVLGSLCGKSQAMLSVLLLSSRYRHRCNSEIEDDENDLDEKLPRSGLRNQVNCLSPVCGRSGKVLDGTILEPLFTKQSWKEAPPMTCFY